jgi:hypothetical protein
MLLQGFLTVAILSISVQAGASTIGKKTKGNSRGGIGNE